MGSRDGGMGNGKWEMGNGKRGMGKYNGKLIFSCFFFFRLTVYSEEQIFFNDFHVLFQKLSKAKFKERNKLMIRKEVIFKEQIMSAANYKSIFSRKLEVWVFLILQIFCNAREKIVAAQSYSQGINHL